MEDQINPTPIIHISSLEHCHCRSKNYYIRHELFEMLWFDKVREETVLEIDYQKTNPVDQSILLLAKRQICHLENPGRGYSIQIDVPFFQQADHRDLRVMFNPFLNDLLCPEAGDYPFLLDLVSLLQQEQSTTNNDMVKDGLLRALLLKLSVVIPRFNIPADKSERMETLFHMVEANFTKNRSTEFYASSIGLSSKRLNQILQQKIGLTMTQLLHRLLIDEAKKKLARGDKNIHEIAFELGFTEQGYFSRFFKKHTGFKPEVFARQHRG